MLRLGKQPIAILCALAVALILGQALTCFAEQAAVLPSAHQCEHPHEPQPASESSGECSAASCHAAFFAAFHERFMLLALVTDKVIPANEAVPDGPVREIDYPPQLS